MKEVDTKNPPDVSGGHSPDDDRCFPPFPYPVDYPPNPFSPLPEPLPNPIDPAN